MKPIVINPVWQCLLPLALLLLLASCAEPVATSGLAARDEGPPPAFRNVVFIVSDDHSPKVLGAYGNRIVRTPNLDRLAAEGTRFTRAYANSPICSASRQSIMTGKYPHATGVNLLFTPFPDGGNVTIAEYLREKGFKTALAGKAHFNEFVFSELYRAGPPDHGWDYLIDRQEHRAYLKGHPPRPVPAGIATRSSVKPRAGAAWSKNAAGLPEAFYDADSEGTFLANWAAGFIRENKDQRFCLWVAFHEPHAPFSFPVEYAGRYKPDEVPLPAGSPEDDRWVPEQFRDLTEKERRGIIAAYYTSVEYMDKNVGLVLEALRENGLEENTLVVFNGDQGYLLNEHKRFEKHTFWEESVRAPLIIRGKGIPAGRRVDALVEFVDLFPTVAEALGFAPHPDGQGKSLLPLLNGQTEKVHEYVFSEYLQDDMAMVADQEWKYIFTTGKYDLDIGYQTGHGPSGLYHRLYHLKADPAETTNLAYLPGHQAKLAELQGVMLAKFRATHPDAGRLPGELNPLGQLVWFCQPRDIGAHYAEQPIRYFTPADKMFPTDPKAQGRRRTEPAERPE